MKYHPDIELLLKYASGQLEPSLAVAVGLHQRQCVICQESISELEEVGGETLENTAESVTHVKPEQLFEFETLMAHIDDAPTSEESDPYSQYDQLAVSSNDLPLFDQLANQRFESFAWQRVGPRIWRHRLAMNDAGFEVELLKFSANAKIPKHTHSGNEFTLVLQGDFSDHQDSYQAGEFIVQNENHEHQPVAGEQGCICLAITNSPLKFTGTLGPVLNWFNR